MILNPKSTPVGFHFGPTRNNVETASHCHVEQNESNKPTSINNRLRCDSHNSIILPDSLHPYTLLSTHRWRSIPCGSLRLLFCSWWGHRLRRLLISIHWGFVLYSTAECCQRGSFAPTVSTSSSHTICMRALIVFSMSKREKETAGSTDSFLSSTAQHCAVDSPKGLALCKFLAPSRSSNRSPFFSVQWVPELLRV